MNNITIAGQLGKDAETRFTSSGQPVLSFSVADSQGKEKSPIWWRCQLFGKRAETLGQYMKKGQAVSVAGRVEEREWKDKDGADRKTMEIIASDVALLGGRPTNSAGQDQQQPSRKPHSAEPKGGTGFDDMDDDIPF